MITACVHANLTILSHTRAKNRERGHPDLAPLTDQHDRPPPSEKHILYSVFPYGKLGKYRISACEGNSALAQGSMGLLWVHPLKTQPPKKVPAPMDADYLASLPSFLCLSVSLGCSKA
jgi:hypothetical protein